MIGVGAKAIVDNGQVLICTRGRAMVDGPLAVTNWQRQIEKSGHKGQVFVCGSETEDVEHTGEEGEA
jgi:hypothetical protein